MPELSQRTLGKLIPILERLSPHDGYASQTNYWRTKLFGAGFAPWCIEAVIDLDFNWPLIITELYRGKVENRNHYQVGEALCSQMLRDLLVLAIDESDYAEQTELIRCLEQDGFNLSPGVAGVAPPAKLRITSDVVEAALEDAETLLRNSGAANALDRVHTAFHGYLEQVCADANITATEDAPITTLFKLIREKHPRLQLSDPQAQQMMVQLLRGSAQIVDALNPVRNDKTLAHPNQLLDEPEAMLAINAIRTMLHYLDKRLS